MRLTPEQVAEEKKYLSELKERVWFGEHGLTSAEQDLFDTIEALQQENEQLQTQVARMREVDVEALRKAKYELERIIQDTGEDDIRIRAKEALAEIDKEIGGKEDA
jgi:hypothetical protein